MCLSVAVLQVTLSGNTTGAMYVVTDIRICGTISNALYAKESAYRYDLTL